MINQISRFEILRIQFYSKELNDYLLDNSKFWDEICSRDKLENLNKK